MFQAADYRWGNNAEQTADMTPALWSSGSRGGGRQIIPQLRKMTPLVSSQKERGVVL